MKKLLVVVLALLMTATMMVACDKNDEAPASTPVVEDTVGVAEEPVVEDPAVEEPVVESEGYGEAWDLFVESYIESAESAAGGSLTCSVERNGATVKLICQYTVDLDKTLLGDALEGAFNDEFKSLTKESICLIAPEVETVIVEYLAMDGDVLCSIEC